MRKILLLLFLSFISLGNLPAQDFWEKLNSPPGGVVTSLTIDNSGSLYAGTNVGGIYRTIDNANGWLQINNGLMHFRILAIVARDNFLFAGTTSGGVYRSGDNGDSWGQFNNGLTEQRVNSLAYNANFIFAGTDNGVFRSADNGESWDPVINGLGNTIVNALTTNGNEIYAGTNGGVFYSADNGVSWQLVNNGLPVNIIITLTFHDNNVFAGTSGFGIYRSSNNGNSWTQENNGLANFNILSLTSGPGFVYAGTEGGIFRSSNDGETWVQINNGLTNLFGNALAVGNSILFAGTNGGIFRSSTNGESWSQANNGFFAVNPLALAIVGDRIYAGTSGGVYYSSNNGTSWVQLNTGLTDLLVYSMTTNGTFIFAGTNGGVYRLSIGGNSWTQVNNGLSNLFGNALESTDNFVFVGTNAGVFRSSNNGNSWTPIDSGLTSSVIELTVNDNYVYAGTNGNGVFRSPIGGNDWAQINNGITNLRVRALAADNNFIYGGTNTGIYRSTDNGNTWNDANEGLSSPLVTTLETGINAVYAATDGGGVNKSQNNGNNWEQINSGLVTLRITTINMGNNGYLYAVTYDPAVPDGNGIYKSLDPLNKLITVQTPGNGTEWKAGSRETVTWTSGNVNENVNIKLSTDGGNTYPITIKSDIPNDGSEAIDVPNNPSASCKLKVESVNDNKVFGVSTGTFTILAVPVITVTAPNSSAEWTVATQQNVTWSSENVTGNLNIKLSTDGGNSFPITLRANTPNDGSVSVDVPDNPSTTCVIKVESVSDNSIFGLSEGNFVIKPKPTISVTDPASSAKWIVGTQENVLWSSVNVAGNVTIRLSTDGGNTFPVTLKSNSANDGTEVIDVPNNPSESCIIKIESVLDNNIFGVSPGNFIIALPTITVTSPVNGDDWSVGSQQTITWESQDVTGNVNIKLSTDGGNTFPTTLKSNTQNDGSEKITVPDKPSANCIVKVESTADNNIFGLSNGKFSITMAPLITVITPSASANWTIGSQQSVMWSSVNVSGNVNIKLSVDGGTTFPITLKSDTPNDSSEMVDVPDNASITCVIKVESVNDNNIFGISSGNFTITSAPTISVIKPEESANWIIGTEQIISWSSVNVPGNINIRLSTDGGNTFSITLRENSANDGIDTIQVPANPSETCRVKVESADNTDIYGLNPGNFSISSQPSIVITAPAASAVWTVGTQVTVTWTSVNVSGNVNILLSTDGGNSFDVELKSNTPNDGSEVIDVPDKASTNCMVKIESSDDNSIFGISEGNFMILSQPEITVTSPLAASKWTIGSSQTVTWSSLNLTGNVNIKLSTDGGTTFTIVLKSDTQNDGAETVTVPDNPSTQCRIKVESVNDIEIFGINPGDFTITSEPTITVSLPAESTKWTIGSQQTVAWTSVDVTGSVNIKLSLDGGASFSIDLASNIPNDGSEVITVPDNQSVTCRIKIESVDDNNVYGLNPGDFTITSEPTIVVIEPAALSNWSVGSQQIISWSSVNVTGNVNIKLSTDGGSTFNIILKADTPDDSSETIDVPNNPSASCRIKVESSDDNNIYGLNPGDFTILAQPAIVVTAPAAAVNWPSGSEQTVTWTSVNVTGSINIKLSTDGGSTYPVSLVSDSPNDGSEKIDVPSNTSDACRIKVESSDNNNIFGLNPGNFRISEATSASLTVNSPSAQDLWIIGTQKSVTWTSVNLTGNVNIKLSTDGGSTFPVLLKENTANDNSEIVDVPDNPSTSCRILIESVDNTGINDISDANFSIISYPEKITVNTTTSFNDISDTKNYKIIGIPGRNNIAVNMNGNYEYDWQVFWDNGTPQNYLVGGSNYTFGPGKAYWILSKNPLVINQQVDAVELNSTDESYSIPLHTGWNLISNPFDKNVSWAAVRTLNGLAENQKIYSWNGKWDSLKTQMVPYEGYYFNNVTGKDSLKIPYFASSSISKELSEYPEKLKEFLKVSVSLKDKTESSEIFIGIDPASKNGYDEKDYFMPPGDFLKSSVSLLRKELPERNRRFFIEQRPSIGEGQIYDLEIKTIPNEITNINVNGIEQYASYNIYLFDERLNNFYNIKENKDIQLRLAHKYNPFKLIMGSNEFITALKQNSLPAEYQLYQNYPNPFNPATSIRFSVPQTDRITISIYNVIGEIVDIPINDQLYEPGNYEIQFDGSNLSTGIYIVEMQAAQFKLQKKMLLLK